MNTDKSIPTLDQMPPIPSGSVFTLRKVEKISMPHPYCITPKHVAWAADHFSGILSQDAIRDAEKHGAVCDICRHHGRILTVDQHESAVTLFIQVPAGTNDLNGISGLHSYLFKNKAQFEALGIQGFAFPSV